MKTANDFKCEMCGGDITIGRILETKVNNRKIKQVVCSK